MELESITSNLVVISNSSVRIFRKLAVLITGLFYQLVAESLFQVNSTISTKYKNGNVPQKISQKQTYFSSLFHSFVEMLSLRIFDISVSVRSIVSDLLAPLYAKNFTELNAALKIDYRYLLSDGSTYVRANYLEALATSLVNSEDAMQVAVVNKELIVKLSILGYNKMSHNCLFIIGKLLKTRRIHVEELTDLMVSLLIGKENISKEAIKLVDEHLKLAVEGDSFDVFDSYLSFMLKLSLNKEHSVNIVVNRFAEEVDLLRDFDLIFEYLKKSIREDRLEFPKIKQNKISLAVKLLEINLIQLKKIENSDHRYQILYSRLVSRLFMDTKMIVNWLKIHFVDLVPRFLTLLSTVEISDTVVDLKREEVKEFLDFVKNLVLFKFPLANLRLIASKALRLLFVFGKNKDLIDRFPELVDYYDEMLKELTEEVTISFNSIISVCLDKFDFSTLDYDTQAAQIAGLLIRMKELHFIFPYPMEQVKYIKFAINFTNSLLKNIEAISESDNMEISELPIIVDNIVGLSLQLIYNQVAEDETNLTNFSVECRRFLLTFLINLLEKMKELDNSEDTFEVNKMIRDIKLVSFELLIEVISVFANDNWGSLRLIIPNDFVKIVTAYLKETYVVFFKAINKARTSVNSQENNNLTDKLEDMIEEFRKVCCILGRSISVNTTLWQNKGYVKIVFEIMFALEYPFMIRSEIEALIKELVENELKESARGEINLFLEILLDIFYSELVFTSDNVFLTNNALMIYGKSLRLLKKANLPVGKDKYFLLEWLKSKTIEVVQENEPFDVLIAVMEREILLSEEDYKSIMKVFKECGRNDRAANLEEEIMKKAKLVRHAN